MENNRHHCTHACVILLLTALTSMANAAQPLNEGSLALQTGMLNNALPSIIIKAQQDALKPEEERWRSQRILSDKYLGDIRVSTILGGVLSPHEEQKKVVTVDYRDKRAATIKPHEQPPDRLMIYEFESGNVHVTYNDDVKAELVIK
ncbi:hypothetical protein [Acinetobacter genomosp. 15BJ]|uniref:Uncharacterized protein n=1 Tax=Acinetobacter genomosp. 15BJ TaxID=106651 RepID=R9AWZ6_9GAMM|nr:hypothetical protein [Acinetobacter genomosp. 15BJ]EOR06722.1 hypothetical protein F896_02404 [Acinetobacter genomosp. 15BJ]MCH7292986.1 hypothetical protein [Acinetobacter genomosp. 15BJ]MDO3656529.1 hypothetical protein [Acinetobacter genomosp. 15BJ]